ncbi:MAG: hypothetical protein ACO1Q7_04320 [Gemmatimonas sp.]
MLRIKEQLKETDELEFLAKRSKQLSLDKDQKEKLKVLNKEQEESEKPVLKDIETAFKELEKMGMAGGGMGGRGGMPEGIRESMAKLTGIQRSFGERAHEMLKAEQKAQADSLRPAYLNDLRDDAERKSGRNDAKMPFVVTGVGRGN